MFHTFEALFIMKNLRKLHILRLRARSGIYIKKKKEKRKKNGFPRGPGKLRNARSNLCASEIDQFTNSPTKEPGPRDAQSSFLRRSCAKEQNSGVENGTH